MAYMIPSEGIVFDKKSNEEYIYNKFKELSDEYYVLHSFRTVQLKNEFSNSLRDGEIDFIIFNPKKGLIIIEAKSGEFQIKDGQWYYQNGLQMSHGGPFQQATINKYKILSIIERNDKKNILKDKVFPLHAVCFPSVSTGYLKNITLPANAHTALIITNDDLSHLEEALDRIYSQSKILNTLNKEEIYTLLDILLPTYKIIRMKNYDISLKNEKYIRLLNDQYALLDYLEFQDFATINGYAGTGKTMIALEKARRLANNKEKVLFLCYNKNLKDYLQKIYNYDYVDFYTIDQLAFKHKIKSNNKYLGLKEYLERCYLDVENFEYKHIIIDEAQDFGSLEIEESQILNLFKYLAAEKFKGNMFIFYDKLQLVQGDAIPEIISNSDCKMTLYKNCRNTHSIATTSMKPIQLSPVEFFGSIKGDIPELYLVEDQKKLEDTLKSIVLNYKSKGYKDILLLSAKSSDKSSLNHLPEFIQDTNESESLYWTTSRKFKGLEAEVIILFDVDEKTFNEEKLVFYVGASRAKFELSIVLSMTRKNAEDLLKSIDGSLGKVHPKFKFAAMLNAVAK